MVPALSSALLSSKTLFHPALCSVGELLLFFSFDGNGPNESQQLTPHRGHDLVLVLVPRRHSFVAFVQPLLCLPGDLLNFLADRQVLLSACQQTDYVRTDVGMPMPLPPRPV